MLEEVGIIKSYRRNITECISVNTMFMYNFKVLVL